MTSIKRGRGLHRGIDLLAVAALGFVLSGCGSGAGSSSAVPSAAASAAPIQTSTPAQASTPAQTPTPAPSPSTGSATPAASAPSGSSGSSPPTASVGTVTLNWLPPTENVDGTPLTNLAGYDIRYGTASGNYTQKIAISNPGIATYVVSNLTPGTYYFSVTAVNAQGTESPLSSEVSTKVN